MCTYIRNRLLRRWCVILLLRKVFILHKEENDFFAVTLVTGNVRYACNSLSISPSIPFTMLLSLSVSAIVSMLVTSLTPSPPPPVPRFLCHCTITITIIQHTCIHIKCTFYSSIIVNMCVIYGYFIQL